MSQQYFANNVIVALRAYVSIAITAVSMIWTGEYDVLATLIKETCEAKDDPYLCVHLFELRRSMIEWWADLWSLQNITVGSILLAIIIFVNLHQLYYSYRDVVYDYLLPKYLRVTRKVTAFHYAVTSPLTMSTILTTSYLMLPIELLLLVSTYLVSTYFVLFFWPTKVVMEESDVKSKLVNGVLLKYVVIDGVEFFSNSHDTSSGSRTEMATSAKTAPTTKPKSMGYLCTKNDEGQYVFHGNFSLINTSSTHFVVTAEHVVEFLTDIYAVNGNRSMRLERSEFIRFAKDAVMVRVPAHFAANMGMSPTVPAQLNIGRPVSIIYGLGFDKFFTSLGAVFEPAFRDKYVFDSYYSSTAGSSGAPIMQGGKIVGIHCGSRGMVDGETGNLEPRNYFVSLFHFISNPRSKHTKLESSLSDDGYWEYYGREEYILSKEDEMELQRMRDEWDEERDQRFDEEYRDAEDLLTYRLEKHRWKDFSEDDQELLEIGHDLWGNDDKRDYAMFAADAENVSRQGYGTNSSQMKEVMANYRAKVAKREANLLGRILTYTIAEVSPQDFHPAGAEPAKQGNAKLGLPKKRSPSETVQASDFTSQALLSRFGKAPGLKSAQPVSSVTGQ